MFSQHLGTTHLCQFLCCFFYNFLIINDRLHQNLCIWFKLHPASMYICHVCTGLLDQSQHLFSCRAAEIPGSSTEKCLIRDRIPDLTSLLYADTEGKSFLCIHLIL